MKEIFELLGVHDEDYLITDDEIWIYEQVLERFEHLEKTLLEKKYVPYGIRQIRIDNPYPYKYFVFKKNTIIEEIMEYENKYNSDDKLDALNLSIDGLITWKNLYENIKDYKKK